MYSPAKTIAPNKIVELISIARIAPSLFDAKILQRCSIATSVKNGRSEPIRMTPRFMFHFETIICNAAIKKNTGIKIEEYPYALKRKSPILKNRLWLPPASKKASKSETAKNAATKNRLAPKMLIFPTCRFCSILFESSCRFLISVFIV